MDRGMDGQTDGWRDGVVCLQVEAESSGDPQVRTAELHRRDTECRFTGQRHKLSPALHLTEALERLRNCD